MNHAVHPLIQQVELLVLNGGGVPGFQIEVSSLKNTEAHIQFLLPFLFCIDYLWTFFHSA